MKNSMNKKLIFLLGAITGLFLIIALYLVYFEFAKSDWLNKHSLNMRNFVDESKYQRGSIYDTNGKVLTHSVLTDNGYVRVNEYNRLYSPIIGYNSVQYGKTGLESSLNNELLNSTSAKDIFDTIEDTISNNKKGNDVYLTIDDRLQNYAYDALGDYKGTIIVSEPKSGKILAMVSKPSFNVNELASNWEEYINSTDAIMINRATQGLYEPGSVFKIVSSLAFLKNGMDLDYNDTGSAQIADHTVHNFGGHAYGEIDLRRALEVSSNTYFYDKSQVVSNQEFLDALQDFGINTNYYFPLLKSDSKFPFKSGLSNLEKGNGAFGQGETYVAPLDMLLVINGIANDGVVYTPYIVDKIVKNDNDRITNPSVLANSMNSQYANQIKSYLESTAKYNNVGQNYGISMAGKTGTAENNTERDHAWYLGMSPVESPEYTIVVMIENAGDLAGRVAAPIAEQVLAYARNNIE